MLLVWSTTLADALRVSIIPPPTPNKKKNYQGVP